jgi:RNA polymerase sigma-70 factor (ECF subfamily)
MFGVEDGFMEAGMATAATFETSALKRSEVIDGIAHLRAFAMVLAGDRQRADGFVRDTIVQTFTAVNRPSTVISLRVRMFAGVRKLHYAALRQSAALPPPQPETQSSKEDGLESDELLGIFRALRDEQREALILTVASGLSHEQAAEVCDCQIDTVKSRVLDAWFEISRMLYQDSVIMTHGPNHVVRWT